jgi:competence protein ComFC
VRARASSRRPDPAGVLAGAWGRALDVALPVRCLLCGEVCPPGEHVGQVCPVCVGALPFIRGRACIRCGIELISEREVCTRCRSRSFEFQRNAAVFPYQGAVRELVHLYKMAGHRSLAGLFARLLAELYDRNYRGLPLVPVPGRPSVRRLRGWEHVDFVAARLQRDHGVPVLRCLRRRGGVTQKALDYEGRLENMRGAFSVVPGAIPEAAVLLDDVITTGATLSECAAALRRGGSRTVFALTLAADE